MGRDNQGSCGASHLELRVKSSGRCCEEGLKILHDTRAWLVRALSFFLFLHARRVEQLQWLQKSEGLEHPKSDWSMAGDGSGRLGGTGVSHHRTGAPAG